MNLDGFLWWANYFTAHYYRGLDYLSMLVAILILLSCLDDLFIDIWYWCRRIYRALTIERRIRPLTVAQLHDRPEQALAIMLPAWKEEDVIAQMVTNLMQTLDYGHFVVFAGTYPNDPPTIAEAEKMRRRYRQFQRVEVPHDGPTCKADCLNWIVQALFNYEKKHGIEFAGAILHDSEDVLHPLELRFFNYLLPRKDMIQLPVASLEREWYELVAGTYMDEFAEWHAKDLVVRESIAHAVPSAGVGTCFSRRALLALSASNNNQPFNTETLTEDYDVGERLAGMGLQSIFARFPVTYTVKRKSWFGLGPERELSLTAPMSVREFFPNTFYTAYRQRARWTLGIALQNWEHMGWYGSLTNRYLLAHDRKGLVTSFVGIFAYILVAQYILFAFAHMLGIGPNLIVSPFIDSPLLDFMLWANGIALTTRVLQRMYFVTILYGWEHGLLSVPRMIVGNFINFMAVARAWNMFIKHLITGKKLAWDKTMHDFPTADGLTDRRQRLGELLVSWRAIDQTRLDEALRDDEAARLPLGRVLVSHGWLDEETLAEAIAFQADLPRGQFDQEKLRLNKDALPLEFLVRNRALPQGLDEDDRMIVLSAGPLAKESLDEMATACGHDVAQRIVRESEITLGLRLLRHSDAAPDAGAGAPLLGDLLIESGAISRNAFDKAMTRYRPADHGRIGDYMVSQGVLTQAALTQALAKQQSMSNGKGANP
ncbi:MAG: glycosyl transferase family protein [Desulfobulbaceae bacterium]|jgi:adsorption protein B|nr:glycosyl transferase family protein [Desulfobulbaceae bacterium]